MKDPNTPGEKLRRSWDSNASAWTNAVRQGKVKSRELTTNAAILQAVLEHAPTSVLDVGCGEGWLARALSIEGCTVTGFDASAKLIDAAREHAQGTFQALSYEDFIARPAQLGHAFDAVICNFSLLADEVTPLLEALLSVTAATGRLFIQTVHPWRARGEDAYVDAWRTENFATFGEGFSEPMPWYYRTLESWLQVLHAAGWQLEQLQEPRHPTTGEPLSLLLAAHQHI